MREQKLRWFLVDGIRGLAIVNMVIFHFLYDIFVVYGKNPAWCELPGIHVWQQAICWTFIFVSGFAWQWGIHGNLRRGLLFNLYGLLISVVTLLFVPSEVTWFGILNFIGCAVLLMFPLQKVREKVPPALGCAISFVLFLLCKQIQHGYIGIAHLVRIQMPDVLYAIKGLTPLGFPFPGFQSSDYFPIIPWIFLYLCGYFFYHIAMKHSAWQRRACLKIPFLSAIGSKSLWVYLLHQPVSLLICMFVFSYPAMAGMNLW